MLDFGADATGATESSDAFDAAIAVAKASGKWTIIRGRQVTLSSPQPDGSIHTGVGFYGKYVDDAGGSRNVHLSDFAIEGDVRERVDTDQVNGVGGALSDSTGAVGVNNCRSFHVTPAGSEFSLTDLGGNDGGWLAPWELPNTITCDDRPPVVPPPPPSPW